MSKQMAPKKNKVNINTSTSTPLYIVMLSTVIEASFTLSKSSMGVMTENITPHKNKLP